MGLRLTVSKADVVPYRPPEYLTPPPEGDSARVWAEEILQLKSPAYEIWIGYRKIVNLADLTPLDAA